MKVLDKDGVINGSVVVREEYDIHGLVLGNITVLSGGDLLFTGICYGNLVVEPGGEATLNGIVYGNVSNRGGELVVREDAEIAGDFETPSGNTLVAPKARVSGR